MATMLTRRTSAHESSMVRDLGPQNPGYSAWLKSLTGAFKGGNGTGPVGGGASLGATHQGQAYIYNLLHRQSAALAYVDIIRYLTIFCACMIPLLFFIPRPPKHVQAGH